MRKLFGSLVIALVAVACGEAAATPPPGPGTSGLLIRQSPSPFMEVSAGPVSALIPDEWEPRLAGPIDDPRQGSSPDPDPRRGGPTGHRSRGSRRCGSTGPRSASRRTTTTSRPPVRRWTSSPGPNSAARPDGTSWPGTCRRSRTGRPTHRGDYVAHGLGTCTVGDRPTRWAYFVAAPGYGPLREVGIPSSGLYVVVAVMPASPRASFLLNRLLRRTEFNGSSVADMLEAAASVSAPADPA